MAEFETLSSEKIPFGLAEGEFLELSVGLVRDGARESKYLRLARGYYSANGEERYKKGGLTLPADREALDKLADALKKFDITQVKGAAPGAE